MSEALARRLSPPRTPGALAPEYGAALPVEVSVARIAEALLRARRRP